MGSSNGTLTLSVLFARTLKGVARYNLAIVVDIIIRKGLLALPTGLVRGDIAIEGEQIAEISPSINGRAKTEINASGQLVMPGAIDTQVHFREPGLTHKEDLATGSKAAVAGGVTTVFEMPNTNPPTTTEDRLASKLMAAEGRMHCDHGFFIGASPENIQSLRILEELPGTPGIKIFMGSSTGSLLIDRIDLLQEVLICISRRCSVHSELESRLVERQSLFQPSLGPLQHPYLRDPEAAVLSTKMLIEQARELSKAVHILHISTAEEILLIAEAKKHQDLSCEVTPQHIFFAAPECYRMRSTLVQMNPPIRDEMHQTAIQSGLKAGLFDIFGSDHAPHLLSEKQRPYAIGHEGSPSGMPGVQTLLPMALKFANKGMISLESSIAMLTSRPAELFGIKNKGYLKVGYDADIVVINHKKMTMFHQADAHYKCGWSPFDGIAMAQMPSHVLLRGKEIAKNGKVTRKASGKPCLYHWK